MLVILNARATALLNISFRNLSQSKHIVELASLAIYLFSARKTGSDMIEDGVSDEEKIWMLKRMIQLVRDDIYTLLLSVDQDLTYADRAEREPHEDSKNVAVDCQQASPLNEASCSQIRVSR
jgi:hypothetical protein